MLINWKRDEKVHIAKFQITRKLAAVVFAVTALVFVCFFLYMGFHENVSVYSPRYSPYYGTIINLTPETVRDESAPLGTRTVYTWLMDAHCETGDYLCFYVSNNHVDVTIDGEQVYALHSSEEEAGENIGKTVSSNWCIIPLTPEDAGKQVTIVLTPLIPDILPKKVEFLIGSNYNIILAQLRDDAPQLIMAIMCITLGLIIFLIQCYLQIFSGTAQWDQMFMGIFSFILGVWRITDIRSAPLIFSGNPKALGYVSIGMLFLASPTLIQFVSNQFQEKQASKVHILAIVVSAVGLLTLGGQIIGIADLGESRVLSYSAMCVAMVTVFFSSFCIRKDQKPSQKRLGRKLLPLLAVGIFMDFLSYFARNNSSELIFTCLFFLIYLSVTFVAGFRETSNMVYRDSRTGLFNKARWNELMQADGNMDGNFGIMVLDLNGLKKVNDTYGHEAGDRLIVAFADILRNALPSSSVICRWGGDEFVVMLPRTNRKKMNDYIASLYRLAEEYNDSDPQVKIYFAMGEILAEDYPDKTRTELFHLADQKMYRNKQSWYAKNSKAVQQNGM